MSTTFNTCKVNVKLCGSIPRDENLSLVQCAPLMLPSGPMNTYLSRSSRNSESSLDCMSIDEGQNVASQLCSQLSSLEKQRSQPRNEYDAPGWAVPACGEARLEPVFDSIDRQPPIDLTNQAVFRVGRSPNSDVKLAHVTSSRKHAMLFHHSNGSCYVIDCESAHGTYVNGARIVSPPNGGVVIPHKVKRGSIIRFGGPGAPSFMLKSFSFELEEMRQFPTVAHSTLSPASAVNAEVEHNTRYNALGPTARSSLLSTLTSKRSFDSMSTVEDLDYQEKDEMRCSSPPLSPQQQQVRLVSPDLSQPGHKRRRVSFSSAPPKAFYANLVSPNLSGDENE
ncbi:unnamed protein product [Cylindrotheca closterium]|uniref:FHA domain-containing protein n=1 Tax=Cylindrotheca closterium TaxID=2856 RepID=A0AAD2JKS3_9STRA|nr:unnamed protein product [Cylindrotheca closterium]